MCLSLGPAGDELRGWWAGQMASRQGHVYGGYESVSRSGTGGSRGEAKRVVGWPGEDEGQGQRKPVLVSASLGPTPAGYLLTRLLRLHPSLDRIPSYAAWRSII